MEKKNKEYWKRILYCAAAIFFGGVTVILAAQPGESLRWYGWSVAIVGLTVAIVAWLMERQAENDD